MDPAAQWAAIVEPWRAVAEGRGFRFVKRTVELVAGGHRCVDYLASGASWLDLEGSLGEVHGFRAARLSAWIESGDARFSLTTFGEASPAPRPKGAAGWVAASMVAPLMRRLVPPDERPVPLREPADLEKAIAKHLAELLAIAAKPVTFATLEERFSQERASRT